MDLPPLSPLSSMYDPRSPCASSKAGSTPSDDDIPRRRSSSAATPPSTPSSSNALRASLDSAAGHPPMQRVSSVMSLDIPTGKAETLPHSGPPPRPATPCSARLPRSRVFIKHPSVRGSLVDPVAVGAAPDGESRLIVRHLARPASPSPLIRHPAIATPPSAAAAPSPLAQPPAALQQQHHHHHQHHHQQQAQQQIQHPYHHHQNYHHLHHQLQNFHNHPPQPQVVAPAPPRRRQPMPLHTNNHNLPNSISQYSADANINNNNENNTTNNTDHDPDDDFYFSDDEEHHPTTAQPASSLDMPSAPHSLPAAATPIPLPPALQSTGGIAAASLAAHSADEDDTFDPDGALRGGPHGVIDGVLSNKVRRAVSALRSISFQTAAPEDVDTAWGQATASAMTAAMAAAATAGSPGTSAAMSSDCGTLSTTSSARKLSIPRRTDARPSSPARRRSRPPLAASRWRRPRGRISSKHGVQSYDCYSEADVRSRRVSEDIPPPPRSLVSSAGVGGSEQLDADDGECNDDAASAAPALGDLARQEQDQQRQPVLGDAPVFFSARPTSASPALHAAADRGFGAGVGAGVGSVAAASIGVGGGLIGGGASAVGAGGPSGAVLHRRETVRDGPQRRSAPVRHTAHRSLWGGRRDGSSNRAAQLLLSNGGQSLFAAATTSQAVVTVDKGGTVQPVDKYVEFIHASAQRETVKPKPKNLTGRVINRAQAVLRRKWK